MPAMTNVTSSAEAPTYLFRFKLFNGKEYHILSPNMETAMVMFAKHPNYEKHILVVSEVAKVDG